MLLANPGIEAELPAAALLEDEVVVERLEYCVSCAGEACDDLRLADLAELWWRESCVAGLAEDGSGLLGRFFEVEGGVLLAELAFALITPGMVEADCVGDPESSSCPPIMPEERDVEARCGWSADSSSSSACPEIVFVAWLMRYLRKKKQTNNK